MKILIVEDETNLGTALRDRLDIVRQKFPHAEIVLVTTLADGLRVVAEIPHPDVTFLDLGLPDSEWFETVARVPEFEGKSPVIIITGHAEEKVRELLRHMPQVEILHKEPSMWGRVLGAVAAAIARRNSTNLDDVARNVAAIRELIANAPPS